MEKKCIHEGTGDIDVIVIRKIGKNNISERRMIEMAIDLLAVREGVLNRELKR